MVRVNKCNNQIDDVQLKKVIVINLLSQIFDKIDKARLD